MRSSYNQQLQVALIDAMDDYTGEPISKWLVNKKMGKNWDTNEERAVFVVRSILLLLALKFTPKLTAHIKSVLSYG